jgi:hypothetical protein
MQRKYVTFDLVAMALLMSSIDSPIVAVGGGAFLPSCTGIIADTFGERAARALLTSAC